MAMESPALAAAAPVRRGAATPAIPPAAGAASMPVPAAALAPLAPGRPVVMLSGQGAQRPGMGADLRDVPEVAAAFACASDVLGFDVAASCDSADALADTAVAQPALCALSVGLSHALVARGVRPGAVLGFSLGQVGALAVAGMLSDEEAFRLVKVRSTFMAEAAAARPGAMSALLRADPAAVEALCARCAQGDVLVPANYNAPGQIVISGDAAAVARAEESWAVGGGRSSRLATAGAFHSPLMAPAAAQLDAYLAAVAFGEPSMPLIENGTAAPLAAADARAALVRHLTGPVRFQQSVEALAAAGATAFVEAGFGGVLVNLVKRTAKDAARICVQDRASLEAGVADYGNAL